MQNRKTQPQSPFSLEQLNEIGNNDEAFTLEMLGKFINTVNECSENMRMALSDKNWPKLQMIAHKNIPSYSFLGLNELIDILKHIEYNGQKPEYRTEIVNLVSLVLEKNKNVVAAIQEYLNSKDET